MTPGRIEEAGIRGRIRSADDGYLLGPLTEREIRVLDRLVDLALAQTAEGRPSRSTLAALAPMLRRKVAAIESGHVHPIVRGAAVVTVVLGEDDE